jgi:hypothetical protein
MAGSYMAAARADSHIVDGAELFFLDTRDVGLLLEVTDGRGWDLDTGHDMMITEPHWVAEKLSSMASVAATVKGVDSPVD